MATIRRHYGKWQAQVRRAEYPSQTKSFTLKKDAEEWARKIEIQIQQDSFGIRQRNFRSFKEIILRYLVEVSKKKKDIRLKDIIYNIFLRIRLYTSPLTKYNPK